MTGDDVARAGDPLGRGLGLADGAQLARTPGVERTSRGRVQGAGHGALEDHAPVDDTLIGDGRRPQQRFGIGVIGFPKACCPLTMIRMVFPCLQSFLKKTSEHLNRNLAAPDS